MRFFTLSLIMLFAFFASCSDCISGKGNRIEKTLTLDQITQLEVDVRSMVEVRFDLTAEKTELIIDTYENMLGLLSFEVESEKLNLTSSTCIKRREDVVIKITCKSLDDISLISGDLAFLNVLESKSLNLNIIGSSDAKLRLAVMNFNVQIKGSGDVGAAGEATNCKYAISGSGDIDAEKLISENADIAIKGSGDVKVNASSTLNVAIKGSGDVGYLGAPKISQAIMGSGNIRQL